MHNLLKSDLDHLRDILESALQLAHRYLQTLPERAVSLAPYSLPILDIAQAGNGTEKALAIFLQRYFPGLTASSGPRSFGYVVGGATPAAIIGDWLTSAFDQDNGEGITIHLEDEAVNLMRQLFGLSNRHFGAFVSGATISNFVGLAIARQWIAHQQGVDIAKEGLYRFPPIKVFSGKPHASIYKALSMLGMGRDSVIEVACLPNSEAINLAELKQQLEKLSAMPAIIVANAGTVNTTSFDDFVAINELKREYNCWLHVDAAFGMFTACSPQLSHLVQGVDEADSIAIDAHKWLNVPYDSAIQFTKHPQLQRQVFQNTNAAYLGELTGMIDYMNHTPETSRRLRALTIWFTLMAYGRDGYREIVERCCAMAQLLSSKIAESKLFRLLTPTNLNVVCFTFSDPVERITTARVNHYLSRLTEDGKVFLTPTIYQGVPGIRAALCNWRTTAIDIEIAWEAITRCAQADCQDD
ncbi:MAG: pyridoxal-dependent decarboxylase [Acidobacteriota bacterium]